jgi:hypothetical protein
MQANSHALGGDDRDVPLKQPPALTFNETKSGWEPHRIQVTFTDASNPGRR